MDNIKIQKIKVAGELIYPATILDAVKDASETIEINGEKVANPTFRKTLREIIEEKELVTATTLNSHNLRITALENADAAAVTAEKIAAWDKAVEDVDTLNGGETEDGSVAKAVKDAKDAITGTAADTASDLTLNGLSKAIAAEEQARKDQIGDLGKVGEGDAATDQTVKGYVDAAVDAASKGAAAEVDALNETLFGKAAEGVEGEDGYVPAVEGEIPAIKARVSANEAAIATLNGDGEGSVAKAASDATANAIAQLISDSEENPIDEKFDTLKEIADWILESEENAEGLNAAERISALENTVGTPAKEAEGEEGAEGYKPAEPATGLIADIAAAQKAADDAQDDVDAEVIRATAAEKAIAEFDEDGNLINGYLKTVVDGLFSAEDTTDTNDYADVF